MKKLFQCFIAIFMLSLSFLIVGCNRKPAYSDIKVEQPAKADGTTAQPSEKPADPVAEVDRKAAETSAQTTSQPPVSPNPQQSGEQKPFTIPAALDNAKGEIKDIPKYPKSSVNNMQYGPLGEATVIFMVLITSDPVEKVATFYDNELKRNGWNITSNIRDPQFYEWNLKKGDVNEGIIKVTKDDATNATYISLTRTEKKPEPKP